MVCSLLLSGGVPLYTCQLSNWSHFRSNLLSSESVSSSPTHLQRGVANKLHPKDVLFSGQSVCIHRFKPVSCVSSEDANPLNQEPVHPEKGKTFELWDSMTAKFAAGANIPFLLLQLPQIILNTRNLLAGNKSALLAVPWLGMLTGLLGNLSLSLYFLNQKETEAMVVQSVGVVSTYIVLLQLAMGEAMPLPQFIAVSVVVGCGLILNLLKFLGILNEGVWHVWEDVILVVGLSTLPQVMWSTFLPYVPNTILPGIISFATAVLAVIMARMGKLPDKAVKFLGRVSGWTATLLFMWMAVAQMWTNLLNPDNIKGLSAVSMLLAMTGNGLFIPRSLFIRDLMWFTGSSWGSIFYGWGNLVCLYCFKCITREFFWASTLAFLAWIGLAFWKDKEAHGLSSPIVSFKELVFGR